MNYHKYQHIEKIGSKEVDGILNGNVSLFYKIDGTNSVVWLKDDKTLGFGSRKRTLSLEDDNAGFQNAITKDTVLYNKLLTYLTAHPTRLIYGEWLVPHTLKTYNQDAWRKFYIFDIVETNGQNNSTPSITIYDQEDAEVKYYKSIYYLDYDIYSKELDALELTYIPRIVKLTNPTTEDIEKYLDETGKFLVTQGLGEGIVIKNYNYRNVYGRITWAKMLCEDFRSNKNKTRSTNAEEKSENLMEHKIISLLTPEHIQKEKFKLEEQKGDWSDRYISELLNRVFDEFWRDNWEIVMKKFHYPTINFKVLKSLCGSRTKEVLGL